ncbi:unnamed protein product [Rhizoctonia solani]|uniref:Uncharacterized protein n=1 Tax=Rhizoctonia solani TaxID=456999 RepID=A0A8H2WGF0_9AGAM|nr:unnamed protein product [Rhizoctonia solani]
MSPDQQEQSGLLSEDYDADTYLESRDSPQPHEDAQALGGRRQDYYRIITVLCIANATAIAAFQVIYPFIRAYSAINIAYSIGNMISPSIGGFLVRPSDHFAVFQGDFWKNNPFALPCFVGILLLGITMLIIMVALPETLPPKDGWLRKRERQMSVSMRASVYSTTSTGPGLDGFVNNPVRNLSFRRGRHERETTDDSEYQSASESLLPAKGPVSVWSVLTPATVPVLITSFALAFLAAAWFTLYPLWAFTAISKGGLGAPESSIGLQLSIRGLLHVLTMLVYAPIEKKLGLYRLYAWSMAIRIIVSSSCDSMVYNLVVCRVCLE